MRLFLLNYAVVKFVRKWLLVVFPQKSNRPDVSILGGKFESVKTFDYLDPGGVPIIGQKGTT